MINVIDPDGIYEEAQLEEFFGTPSYKLLTNDRRDKKVRHYQPTPDSARFYKGADVIGWMEQFAVEVSKPDAAPVVVDGGTGKSK